MYTNFDQHAGSCLFCKLSSRVDSSKETPLLYYHIFLINWSSLLSPNRLSLTINLSPRNNRKTISFSLGIGNKSVFHFRKHIITTCRRLALFVVRILVATLPVRATHHIEIGFMPSQKSRHLTCRARDSDVGTTLECRWGRSVCVYIYSIYMRWRLTDIAAQVMSWHVRDSPRMQHSRVKAPTWHRRELQRERKRAQEEATGLGWALQKAKY